jgi:hypothetical protein
MHRNRAEKNRDNLIGQAALQLLKSHGQVDAYSLAGRLRTMADDEQDHSRKMALIEASTWVLEKDSGQMTSVRSGLKRGSVNSGDHVAGNPVRNPIKKH